MRVGSQAEKTAWAEAGARWMQLEAAGAQNVLWGVSAEEAEAEEADRDQNVRTLVLRVFHEGL